MTTTVTWESVVAAMLLIARRTHCMGMTSCFGNVATDVADQRQYPEGIAGAVLYAKGLQRVFDRYVDPHYRLDFAVNRQLSRGWYAVVDDVSVAGPFRTKRGANQCLRLRRLSGRAMRLQESKEQYVARIMDRVDRQLEIESEYRNAADALDEYCGVSDRFQLRERHSRWYDAPHQSERREQKLRHVESITPDASYVSA